MSDCMIIRRGGGGKGFDPNGAVLKVVTSTGCTVLVTGTGYSKTHQQADGYPRSGDANVTEHFFSIPASAFGTITVTVSKVYTNEGVSDTLTASKTITVNTAGKVYELLIAAPNIILNSTFGLQSGWSFSSPADYSSAERAYKLYASSDDRRDYVLYNGNKLYYSFAPYSKITISWSQDTQYANYVKIRGTGVSSDLYSSTLSGANSSLRIDLTEQIKMYDPLNLYIDMSSYRSGSGHFTLSIKEIVFE